MMQCISTDKRDFLNVLDEKSVHENIPIKSFDLNRNIRFTGQGSGINWLVHQMQIAENSNYEDWNTETYKIEIVDSPNELIDIVHKGKEIKRLNRIIVRYDDIKSITISQKGTYIQIPEYNFSMPIITSQSQNAGRWYIEESMTDSAIGVMLTQGTELDYACVIVGDELKYDEESGKIVLSDNAREVFEKRKISSGSKIDNKVDYDRYLQIIKNEYYIAFSRGKRGTYIFCKDKCLNKYLSKKVFYASRRYSWIQKFIEQYELDEENNIIKKESLLNREEQENNQFDYVMVIYEKFNKLIECIKLQIEGVVDETLYKKISDQCSLTLLDLQLGVMGNEDIVQRYTLKIIENIGESAWGKLGELSRRCLISAEIIFHDLKDYNQLFDLSGVCVQVSKAVEYELTQRFLCEYLKFLKKKYNDNLMDKIPNTLLVTDGNKKTIISENLYTLGNIKFTVGVNNEGEVKNNYVYNNFREYAKKNLLVDSQNSEKILKKHIIIIQKIKDEYRNKAAHKTPIDVVIAKDCIDYVVEIERKLGMMLDEYRY